MRFLLDENVRAELDAFLREKGCAVKRLSKGAPDRSLASASREERRVIVTNDEDFLYYPKGKVFSVVLLRVPQGDASALIHAFQRLLAECTAWQSHAIILTAAEWKASPLPRRTA